MMIDSGATNHMMDYIKFFSSYNPSLGSFKVKAAYGSLSTVARTRTIRISPNIEVHSFLHILNLSCNLLYISKLTRHLTCGAHFFEFSYVFQDLTSEKRIGNSREHEGLYYFEKEVELNKQT